MSILDTIVEKRRTDIAQKGVTFGYSIPETRTRGAPVPFVAQKSVILEVKRASPSKGDIAPSLDASACAKLYEAAGAGAISVLTENHFFKGDLRDLMAVSAAVGKNVAVLRKDFLLFPEEIEIAYRCGADAVLLISRILSTDLLCQMAKECARFHMTAFIEVRLQEDLEKLKAVAAEVPTCALVCGVNARDLKTFTIDLLRPARMLRHIQDILGQNARVVFESGIKTPEAAAFASSLGFTGLLLGEAAAKNPNEAHHLVQGFTQAHSTRQSAFWLSYATVLYKTHEGKKNSTCQKSAGNNEKPLVKICGLTSTQDALYATLSGATFLGFIFCAASKRNVSHTVVTETRRILDEQFTKTCQDEHIFAAGEDDERPYLVGVITDCTSPEALTAIQLCKAGVLDVLQVHGERAIADFFAQPALREIPHYCALTIGAQEDLQKIDELLVRGESRILLDAKSPHSLGGTGLTIDKELLRTAQEKLPLWVAGGLSPQNVGALFQNVTPELIDVNSGIEDSPGKKNNDALLALFSAIDGYTQKAPV